MRVQVTCLECGRKQYVMFSIKHPWPKCCGYTMRLSETGGKRFVRAMKNTKEDPNHAK
jgi:ribosomal protein S27E